MTTTPCCDQDHSNGEPGGFYVTVKDGGRTGWLLGPYGTHEEALDLVGAGRKLAESVNDRAFWYAYGTSRIVDGRRPDGLLNSLLAELAAFTSEVTAT
jgi:hypothetical protein